MAIEGAVYAVNEIREVLNSGITGAIKQVASGVYPCTLPGGDRGDVTITTGITVDPAKTLVLVSSGLHTGSSASAGVTAYHSILKGKTATTITCTAAYFNSSGTYSGMDISWQLVEFY